MVSLSNFPSKRGQKELAHFAEREEPKVMSTAEEKTMQRISAKIRVIRAIRVRNKIASSKFGFFEFFDVEKTSM